MKNLENLRPQSQLKIPYITAVWEKTNSRQDAWIVLVISMVAIMPAWMNYDILARDGAHLK